MKTIFASLTGIAVWLCGTVLIAQAPDKIGYATPPEMELRVVAIAHVPVEDLQMTLATLGDVHVISDPTANRLVLQGPKEKIQAMLELIEALDRSQPTVTINVIEVAESPDAEDKIQSGKTAEVRQTMDQAAKQGWLKVLDRLRFSVADRNVGSVQVGRQAPTVTARQSRGGGPSVKSYTFSQVGSVFEATPRVSGNAVLLQFSFEKSESVPSGDDSEAPASIVKTSTNSTVRIPMDQSVVIAGMRMGPDNKPIRWKLIISADVD